MPATLTERLTTEVAAELLGVTPRTLYAWRATGYGPRSTKYAGRLFYTMPDIRAFLTQVEERSARGGQ